MKPLVLSFDTVTGLRDAMVLVQTPEISGTPVKSHQWGHHFLVRTSFGNLLMFRENAVSGIEIWQITLQQLLFCIISMLIQPVRE